MSENLFPSLGPSDSGAHPLLARSRKKERVETWSHPLLSFVARSADAIRQSIEIIYNGRSLKGKTLEATQRLLRRCA